jgi:hypothetical protein
MTWLAQVLVSPVLLLVDVVMWLAIVVIRGAGDER